MHRIKWGTLGLSPTEWRVINMRYGFAGKATLEDVGRKFGVTRERIRQIEERAIKKLRRNLSTHRSEIDRLEAALKRRRPRPAIGRSGNATLGILSRASNVARKDLTNIALVIRTVGANRDVGLSTSWPTLGLLLCGARPPITKYPGLATAMAEAKRQQRPWPYAKLARNVLERSGKAMHWTAIAEQAEHLGHRRNFNRSTFYNAITAGPEQFVRTDQGTYGLAEWGLTVARQYVDIIGDVLAGQGRPLSYGEIANEVNAEREIMDKSLQMFLSLHPRFYESVDGKYGLRAWLQPRYKQTLLTPPELVESADSFERVARSEARGYHVDQITDEDRGSSRQTSR